MIYSLQIIKVSRLGMLYIAVLQRVSVFDVLQGPNRFRAPFLAGVSANCFSEVPLRLCSGSRRGSHSNSAVVVSQWKPIVHILNQAMDKGVWTQCHEEQTVLSGQSYLLMTLYLQVLFRSLRMCSEKAELLWNCHFSWKLNIVELASVNFSLKKKKKQKGFLIFGKSEFALEELEWRQGLRWGVQRPAKRQLRASCWQSFAFLHFVSKPMSPIERGGCGVHPVQLSVLLQQAR